MKNIKNEFFKSTINLIGNKGLSKNFAGKFAKKYLVNNCKTSEIFVNECKMFLDENDIMQLSLFDYEPVETQIVKDNIKKNDIVVDVGANIGYYTLLMAKNNAMVHSYEPESKNFNLLEKNVSINNFSSNVILYNKAVSDFNGSSKLVLSDFSPGQHKLVNSWKGTKSIDIEVTTIELDKIDFAKIDVEGAEFNVLKGMKTLPNKILIEFNAMNLEESGSNCSDFLNYLNKYTIKEVSDFGLIEPDYEKLLENKMATNLFLC